MNTTTLLNGWRGILLLTMNSTYVINTCTTATYNILEGIGLVNMSNKTIFNTFAAKINDGMILQGLKNCLLSNTTVTYNSNHGIVMYVISNALIINALATDNSFIGIVLKT